MLKHPNLLEYLYFILIKSDASIKCKSVESTTYGDFSLTIGFESNKVISVMLSKDNNGVSNQYVISYYVNMMAVLGYTVSGIILECTMSGGVITLKKVSSKKNVDIYYI